MTIERVFSVYDSKMQMYLPLFFVRAPGAAVRSFSEAANQADHPFCKNPEDFILFQIGEFCQDTGVITALPAKISLGMANDFKQQAK